MNQDFRDLLAEFNAGSVEYLVVGAHALAVHGFVRATKDLDVWVRPHAANASRVVAALAAFGAPLHDLTAADMAAAGTIFQSNIWSGREAQRCREMKERESLPGQRLASLNPASPELRASRSSRARG